MSKNKCNYLFVLQLLSTFLIFYVSIRDVSAAAPVKSCSSDGDQDDMCIWLHPKDPAKSTIITSDKDADALYVYDLKGTRLYSYSLNHAPGNIDIRYNFPFGNRLIDIVGYDVKRGKSFQFYEVNQENGELKYLGSIPASGWDGLYGFCLYHSPNDDKFYAFGSDYESLVQQYHIYESGGKLTGKKVRSMQNGTGKGDGTEGIVADDELGLVYIANENEGIYVYKGDGNESNKPIRTISIKKGELELEVEGVTIYYAANSGGYIIASSQFSNFFSVFERKGDNKFVGTFQISGVQDTDGIDVLNVNLNPPFEKGIFVCHNGRTSGETVELVTWEDISNDISPNLLIDTEYWNPRDSETNIKPVNYKLKPFSIIPHPKYIHVIEAGNVTMNLLKINGQKIRDFSVFFDPGKYQYPSLFSIASGNYILTVRKNKQSIAQKIILTE